MLFLSAVSRGKEAEFLILWECLALFSWEMSEAAADLNERSSSLKICYAVINAGFCWWAADGPLMSLYFSSTQRHCGSSRSLPAPLLPTQAQDFIVWRQEFTVTFKGYAEFEEKGCAWFYHPASSFPSAHIDVLLYWHICFKHLAPWVTFVYCASLVCNTGAVIYLFYLSSICYVRKSAFSQYMCDVFSQLEVHSMLGWNPRTFQPPGLCSFCANLWASASASLETGKVLRAWQIPKKRVYSWGGEDSVCGAR